ncbi:lasso RiPP family leader peptide-containing protein [Spirosoma sp. KNUC1025]|uniref:lasso RiPP family leader peptide-containing protein n=1 Tax=Spirosoma sp. KNUC1025 TaxID=2894082 RepID=UPI0038646124|nr:lasso RiPP family leader peptide-containing protein [Spirosoma sp. KNUC1025]
MKEYNDEHTTETQDSVAKKTYKSPQLTKHGNVKNLTLGVGSVNFDEGSIIPDLD